MIIILKAIIGWIILMLIGTNLLGMIARGFLQPLLKPKTEEPLLMNFYKKHKRSSDFIAFLFICITICYFYLLYYYWNIGVVVSAAMIMISRVPDLLFEIKTGQKIKFGKMPKKPIDYIFTIILWAALPILWYSLNTLK